MVVAMGCGQQLTQTPAQRLTLPTAPTNLTASAKSKDTVNLSWMDTSSNEDGFRIYRDGVLVAEVGQNTQTYRDMGLQHGTTYQYAVRAHNQAGESHIATYAVRTLPRIGKYIQGTNSP